MIHSKNNKSLLDWYWKNHN